MRARANTVGLDKIESCKPISRKKRMKVLQEKKQWLLDNKDYIFNMDCYENYYRHLGETEQRIMELKAEKK